MTLVFKFTLFANWPMKQSQLLDCTRIIPNYRGDLHGFPACQAAELMKEPR